MIATVKGLESKMGTRPASLEFLVAGQSCGDEVTEGPHLAASGSLQNQTLHQSSIASIDDYLIALAAQHQPDVDVGLIGESRGSINTTYIECGFRYSQPPVPSSKHKNGLCESSRRRNSERALALDAALLALTDILFLSQTYP